MTGYAPSERGHWPMREHQRSSLQVERSLVASPLTLLAQREHSALNREERCRYALGALPAQGTLHQPHQTRLFFALTLESINEQYECV